MYLSSSYLYVHLLQIGKFDTETKEMVYWNEDNCCPSEPVFIPRPNGESEDDGEESVVCRQGVWYVLYMCGAQPLN